MEWRTIVLDLDFNWTEKQKTNNQAIFNLSVVTVCNRHLIVSLLFPRIELLAVNYY